jgi:hypothetical protein
VSLSASPPITSLRRRTEQALAANPAGIGWRALAEEVARRALASGRPFPRQAEVARELGGLIAEGRVEDRGGRFVLLPVAGGQRMPALREAA